MDTKRAAASDEPVSLDLAKAHCRIDIDDEDMLLEQVYIPAGRQTVEQYTGNTIKPVDTVDTVGRYSSNALRLTRFPAFDLQSLEMVNSDRTTTPLDIDEYGAAIVNNCQGSYVLTTKALPSPTAFRVAYTAGYEPGTVPPNLILAILEFTGDGYENRESQQAGAVLQRNPRAVALMDPFRITFGI